MVNIFLNNSQNSFKRYMNIAIWQLHQLLFPLFGCNMDSFAIVACKL